MKQNMNCPGIEELTDYFSNTLEDEKRRELEEHVFTCDHCTQMVRKVSLSFSRQRIKKAKKPLGTAWEKYGDAIEAKAASEKHSLKIREFLTSNGKFKVTLRPLEKNPAVALLEIEVFDHSIKGQLKISGINHFNEIAEIDDNNLACIVVNSAIDLNRIIINQHQ